MLNVVELISKKRDGHVLSPQEIRFLIQSFADGALPDYQMSALAMAIFLRGMTSNETSELTKAMLESGQRLTWAKSDRPVVDKHSTGGIGDKTSLILAPLLAAAGCRVPMISGRGLGPTGGTLDKLEAIPGFRTNLELEEIERQVEQIGCVITGATSQIAPADKKLYALRDVTATVPSIPLISASIMSKKLAESPEALVLDVKWGSGAFMQKAEDARELARSMVEIGRQSGVKTSALLTDMNQPLGRMAGNASEVIESLEVLRGKGPEDTRELTLMLGAELLVSCDRASEMGEAREQLSKLLASGAAMEKFEQMVAAQGGRLNELRIGGESTDVRAARKGFICAMQVDQLGYAVIDLGGGRKQLGDPIDPSVGIEMNVRLGAAVGEGDSLVRVVAPPGAPREAAIARIARAITLADAPPPLNPLLLERITPTV